jgi:hypothetical protein
MTLAVQRPDIDQLPPPVAIAPPAPEAQFSLAAQLLNTHVLCNLICESDLPTGVDPDDPQLVYYDLPGGRQYLEFQFCRSGAGRIHPFVVNTNNLLAVAYRPLESFPASPLIGPLISSEQERVRNLLAEWWLKPNSEVKFGTITNPHHWYAQPSRKALTPFDCLVELHASRPRLCTDSIEWTLRNATRNL